VESFAAYAYSSRFSAWEFSIVFLAKTKEKKIRTCQSDSYTRVLEMIPPKFQLQLSLMKSESQVRQTGLFLPFLRL